MTFWVHRLDGDAAPSLPARRADGYPKLLAEIDGFTFEFSSLHELHHLIDVFETKILPQTRYPEPHPVNDQGGKGFANRHWISRLPAKVKNIKYRQKAAGYLRSILPEIEKKF